MARVASCPQCNHDLFVPDEADGEAWAKCPECRTFFQVKQAALRAVPAILLVDADPHAAQVADKQSAPTVADLSSLATWSEPTTMNSDAEESFVVEADPLVPPPQSGDELQAAAQRIDDWFRSAKTVPDVSPVAAEDLAAEDATLSSDDADSDFTPAGTTQTNATIDLSAAPLDYIGSGADFELEDAIEPSDSSAAWDDSQHMERLFTDIESPPTDDVAATAVQSAVPQAEDERDQSVSFSPSEFSPDLVTTRSAAGRRKRSPVRTLVMIVMAGVVGLTLGYYALLWLRGPSGDFLEIAQYLPPAALPASFQAEPRQLATNPPVDIRAGVKEAEQSDPAPDVPPETLDDLAEMQAGYTTTTEPAAPPTPQANVDRYGIPASDTESAPAEPAELNPPSAAALSTDTETTEPVRIADAPSFTADELRAAFEIARESQPNLLAGSLADGIEVQRAKGYSYSMLADLAQKLSFIEGAQRSDESQPLQQATEELFRQTLADPHTRAEVAQILPKWIDSPNRKHGGVFFAGRVTSQESKGSVVECRVELEAGQSITILAPSASIEQPIDSARVTAVVGWIVERPAEQVSGYTGSEPQVIWAGKLIPLE